MINSMPEQIKYFLREMRNPRANASSRLEYKRKIEDIRNELSAELNDFEKNFVFSGKGNK